MPVVKFEMTGDKKLARAFLECDPAGVNDNDGKKKQLKCKGHSPCEQLSQTSR